MPSDVLLEQVQNEAIRCVNCGMCKAICPLFLASREDLYSARGIVFYAYLYSIGKREVLQKLLELVRMCIMCRCCEVRCPPRIKIVDKIVRPLRKLAYQKQ